MPGLFTSFFLVAFVLDDCSQVIQAFPPKLTADEEAAIAEGRLLGEDYVGVLVFKREARPSVGEEGDAIIVWQRGKIGDFD